MSHSDEFDNLALFEEAPIALWLQDFGGIKAHLDRLRINGVADLAAHIDAHPEVVDTCMKLLLPLKLNKAVLALYGAPDETALYKNIGQVFRDEMREIFRQELISIWNGADGFESQGVNYTLDGRKMDIQLHWRPMPGHARDLTRVLVSIEDITTRKRTEAALEDSERHFRGLFENSPVALWLQDFSVIKTYLGELRQQGVTDLAEYICENKAVVETCMMMIKSIETNRATLKLYQAGSEEELLSNLGRVFRNEMHHIFREELLDIWRGRGEFESEGVNYSLRGDPLNISLHWTVMPGYEQSLGSVLVSVVDLTARKKAEEYLKYLGTHDVLTGLYNRGFFEEERARMARGRQYPITIMIGDVDWLKNTNDTLGHAAGDELLRRAGEVLKTCFRDEDVVARIGGDEFAVLLPDTDEVAAAQALARMRNLINYNNSYYQGPPLGISLGVATAQKGDSLLDIQREADDKMYNDKRLRKSGLG